MTGIYSFSQPSNQRFNASKVTTTNQPSSTVTSQQIATAINQALGLSGAQALKAADIDILETIDVNDATPVADGNSLLDRILDGIGYITDQTDDMVFTEAGKKAVAVALNAFKVGSVDEKQKQIESLKELLKDDAQIAANQNVWQKESEASPPTGIAEYADIAAFQQWLIDQSPVPTPEATSEKLSIDKFLEKANAGQLTADDIAKLPAEVKELFSKTYGNFNPNLMSDADKAALLNALGEAGVFGDASSNVFDGTSEIAIGGNSSNTFKDEFFIKSTDDDKISFAELKRAVSCIYASFKLGETVGNTDNFKTHIEGYMSATKYDYVTISQDKGSAAQNLAGKLKNGVIADGLTELAKDFDGKAFPEGGGLNLEKENGNVVLKYKGDTILSFKEEHWENFKVMAKDGDKALWLLNFLEYIVWENGKREAEKTGSVNRETGEEKLKTLSEVKLKDDSIAFIGKLGNLLNVKPSLLESPVEKGTLLINLKGGWVEAKDSLEITAESIPDNKEVQLAWGKIEDGSPQIFNVKDTDDKEMTEHKSIILAVMKPEAVNGGMETAEVENGNGGTETVTGEESITETTIPPEKASQALTLKTNAPPLMPGMTVKVSDFVGGAGAYSLDGGKNWAEINDSITIPADMEWKFSDNNHDVTALVFAKTGTQGVLSDSQSSPIAVSSSKSPEQLTSLIKSDSATPQNIAIYLNDSKDLIKDSDIADIITAAKDKPEVLAMILQMMASDTSTAVYNSSTIDIKGLGILTKITKYDDDGLGKSLLDTLKKLDGKELGGLIKAVDFFKGGDVLRTLFSKVIKDNSQNLDELIKELSEANIQAVFKDVDFLSLIFNGDSLVKLLNAFKDVPDKMKALLLKALELKDVGLLKLLTVNGLAKKMVETKEGKKLLLKMADSIESKEELSEWRIFLKDISSITGWSPEINDDQFKFSHLLLVGKFEVSKQPLLLSKEKLTSLAKKDPVRLAELFKHIDPSRNAAIIEQTITELLKGKEYDNAVALMLMANMRTNDYILLESIALPDCIKKDAEADSFKITPRDFTVQAGKNQLTIQDNSAPPQSFSVILDNNTKHEDGKLILTASQGSFLYANSNKFN